MTDPCDRIWTLLEEGAGAGRERSPFTMLQAATLGLDGAPKVRTVVLRGADRQARTLMFHTDARAAKVAELARDARIALVGCDLVNGLQIRVEGTATRRTDTAGRLAIWRASRPRTLVLYRAPLPPGTPVATPADAQPCAAGNDASLDGFEHFAVFDVHVATLDWLDLSRDGHQRARLVFGANGWQAGWIAP
ncbi:Pyridoxine/pyridoxamine 5'-phosphate oxidase [Burkholderia glumae]|uniref:pyridoxamine 5'-phosphate oxidase family protein n=1 Tax=Burkholderia glumae TaxID=337 RepID=UPI001373EB69|nr:pyridoxamine 5'-phosphate oxidase family protein [Burkholderia glumae]MCR1769238.1 pyridoxamine 5'-phosphate oxidase family protein [Burkholderia glumae]QHP93653.1 pyridoxamine 5'-phosphate oxidase [Burkholderia glumae]QKM51348.1 Pyridoxine/pyridoxamine 5'-phosphate oxidase [Burkholderia glumae]